MTVFLLHRFLDGTLLDTHVFARGDDALVDGKRFTDLHGKRATTKITYATVRYTP